MVDLGGYVIVLVQHPDAKIKLYGSPADKSDCDEILEINGKSLENHTHQQIIQHIHQCIRTRTICLRVKRRTTSGKIAIDSSLVDAFIIGDRAREHLQQIAKNSNITPRDISQLSRILSEAESTRGRIIDTVTLPDTKRPDTSTTDTSAPSTAKEASSTITTTTTTKAVIEPIRENSKLEQRERDRDRDRDREPRSVSAPEKRDPNRRKSDAQTEEINSTVADVVQLPTSAKSVSHLTQAQLAPQQRRIISSKGRTDSGEGEILDYEISADNMELVELNHHNISGAGGGFHAPTGPGEHHRELPVDVPDSFVGVTKQSPRYPPPPPHPSQRTAHPSKVHPDHMQSPSPQAQQGQYKADPEKIRRYSEDVKQKKEREAEEEFLRSSLRGSKKLQQLEKQRKLRYQEDQEPKANGHRHDHFQPAINKAFEPDDQQDTTNESSLSSPVHQPRCLLPVEELDAALQRIAQSLNGHTADLIKKANLSKLLTIYTTITQERQQQEKMNARPEKLPPQYKVTIDLLQDVISLLQDESLNVEAAELLEILTRFELEGLCYAHDQIASKLPPAPEPEEMPEPPQPENLDAAITESSTLPASASAIGMQNIPSTEVINANEPVEVYDEEGFDTGVRIVRIEKSSCEPLGATVKNEADGSVIIGRIVKGGAAEKCGLLHEGDEILEINGIEMKGRNVNQVCDLLAEMTGTLTFVIAVRDPNRLNEGYENQLQGQSPQQGLPQLVHLKALFDYDPDDDLYIPCRELGICFSKGDILHVIDQADPNWWQAYREGEQDQTLAGLIPSIQFQLQREAMKQSLLADVEASDPLANITNRQQQQKKTSAMSLLLNCGKKPHHRRKKRKPNSFKNRISMADEIMTYEEVSLYYPRANIKRPIVLIGPTNIGRHELRQLLMQDTERFAAAVPHTSRPKRDTEIDAVDYHFISRSQFEEDIKEGKFVEHGEYERNYYGTSLAAIEAVVESGKICVLNLHVHSIPILRQGSAGARLKPFFVFVAPPTQLEKLNRLISATTSASHKDSATQSDLQAIVDEAREIEQRFGHLFDMVLSITDIDRAYQELLREINALEREPQWIPAAWLQQ